MVRKKQDDQHEHIFSSYEDTGYSPEDLPEAMNDREKWRESIRDIRTSGTTWWWWRVAIVYSQLNDFNYLYRKLIIQNQSFVSTHLNGFKYYYTPLTIKHQSFVLFLTIQYNVKSFVCTHFECQTVLFDSQRGSYQVLSLPARVNLGSVAMKRHSAFPKAPALLDSHHQMV